MSCSLNLSQEFCLCSITLSIMSCKEFHAYLSSQPNLLKAISSGEGRWPRGRADVSEPGGPGFDSSSRQPQVVAHQH